MDGAAASAVRLYLNALAGIARRPGAGRVKIGRSPKPSVMNPGNLNLEALRGSAVRRSLFAPVGLAAAIERLGYVQADPIRAPARAQDLILRPRVRNYRDGDLERRYARLGAEEDVLHNYGFLPRSAQTWLHPRGGIRVRRSQPALEERVLEFMRGRGPTHPRELDAHFGKTTVANVWGGQSSMSSRALDHLHYRGHLRVARREQGIRLYEAAPHLQAFAERPLTARQQLAGAALILLRLYAPMPVASLRQLVGMLKYGAPQLVPHLGRFGELLEHLRQDGTVREAAMDGVPYIWPADERLEGRAPARVVRLLAPFDPVVWDRRRFEHLWGWNYRFEAYMPAARRRLGYYALPVLWGSDVVGWANARAADGRLQVEAGLATQRGKEPDFKREFEAELERFRDFLGCEKIARVRWLK
jgi:uncharacterized protein YcaQ